MQAKPKITPGAKMKGLFWTKLKSADVPGTIWDQLRDFQFSSEFRGAMDGLFSAAPIKTKSTTDTNKVVKIKQVVLFDSRRTQNVLIAMGKVKKPPRELVKIILEVGS